jgi:hypothetical protein
MKYIFIRNDDVRGTLDNSLIAITELCIKHEVPISLAVEPANVSQEVVEWILNLKKEHCDLIEIIQHGYNHKNNLASEVSGQNRKGEFGGARTYDMEYGDLSKGKIIMDKYFADDWSPFITFPFGSYNANTIKACSALGYRGMSSSIGYSLKSTIKNILGQFLKKDIFMGKRIPYHNQTRPGTSLYELDISVNLIKKYLDVDKAEHYSIDELMHKINHNRTNVIGILLHHRFHNAEIDVIEELICRLKEKQIVFSTMEKIRNEKK